MTMGSISIQSDDVRANDTRNIVNVFRNRHRKTNGRISLVSIDVSFYNLFEKYSA